ncbi:hypothetical protein DM819_06025 [Pseudomonas hunanensis]|uniref:Uncharacterized protein n=1 Tax=Pseudomonas hunanensis TaxID=1247546 RepID=A0ABD6MV61_9PSED|nr:hypothetical protein [Pseudomonas hunanensis]NWL45440.1 hypothetical protein [Pseudomonas hunanensis]
MQLVRLAAIEDYEAFDMLGCTMYRIAWCDKLCPGNPTELPEEGIALFNEWQCAVAAGHADIESPAERLGEIVSWCLSEATVTAVRLASEIVKRSRNVDYVISLEFATSEFEGQGLAYRYELAFLNAQAGMLPAAKLMELQNLIQVKK